jgi:Cu/Ag efflux pump CusA
VWSLIRASNMDTGGRTVEISETECPVRGRGLFRDVKDIEMIALKTEGRTPVLPRDVARVEFTTGPSTIRSENAQLAAYIFADTRDRAAEEGRAFGKADLQGVIMVDAVDRVVPK